MLPRAEQEPMIRHPTLRRPLAPFLLKSSGCSPGSLSESSPPLALRRPSGKIFGKDFPEIFSGKRGGNGAQREREGQNRGVPGSVPKSLGRWKSLQ